MTTEDDIKRKRLLELMRGSIQPAQTTVDPSLTKNFPQMRPEALDPDQPSTEPRFRDWNPAQSQPITPRISVGVSTRGLQGIDKSIGDLQAEERAAKDFPSSKVVDGEILPPKMYHGLGDRIKQGLKGLVVGMGDVSRSDPNASAAKILAGGATGGAIGAVDPQSADVLLNQARMPMRRAEVGQQIQLADEQAQVEARQAEPILRAQQIQNEAENRKAQQDIQRQLELGRIDRAEAQRQIEALKQAETERHNRESERLGQARIDKPPTVKPEKPDTSEAQAKVRYDKASEYWDQALAKEKEADSQDQTTYEGQQKAESLRKEAADLKSRTRKLQEQGDALKAKAISGSPRADTRKGSINFGLWKKNNPNASQEAADQWLQGMRAKYPNAVIVN